MVALAGFCLTIVQPGGWSAGLERPPVRMGEPVGIAVWAALYVLAALAGWEVWRAPDTGLRNHRALRVWGWVMGCKALWLSLLFGLHALLPALAAGAAAFGLACVTLAAFARLNRWATLLMLPFTFWLGLGLFRVSELWWLSNA